MKGLNEVLNEDLNEEIEEEGIEIEKEAVPELTPEEAQLSKEEIHQILILKEASGAVPAITRHAKILQVIGEKGDGDRIFVMECFGTYFYMFEEEAPEEFAFIENNDLINRIVKVKPIGIEENKIIVSHKRINEYYEEMKEREKILFGRIKEIKPYPKNKKRKMAIIISKGDYLFVPHSELTDELAKSKKNFKDKVVGFIVIGVEENRKIASIAKVNQFHKDTLLEKLQNGETVTMRVGNVDAYGAQMFYKNDIECFLRNKDFSKDYTYCMDYLKKGDKLKVKLKMISGHYQNIYVEPAEELVFEKPDTTGIKISDQIEGEVVSINAFGCFVRIAPGKDVLCPVEFGSREPLVGEKVLTEVVSVDHLKNKMRAKIINYIDEKLDLEKYNLLGGELYGSY